MLIQIHKDRIEEIAETSLSGAGVRERADLQRLLKHNIRVLGEDLLVIAEEFGDFEDSNRRIDLLALDHAGNLVVIELKREKGAHMDLQAVRYAAMVSTMRFDQAVSAYERFLESEGITRDARATIQDFLDSGAADEEPALGDVRIVLASEDFSRELTSAVLWLAEYEIDIRCVRVKAYRLGDALLAEVNQVLPLPEAEEYMIEVGKKRREQKVAEQRVVSMEEFWRRMEPTALEPMQRLVEWLEPRASYLSPGKGGCVPFWRVGSEEHSLFRLRTDGRVAILFDRGLRKAPFSERALREELRARLNTVPGIEVSEERLEGRPRFDVRVLTDPSVAERFHAVVEWWMGKVGATGISDRQDRS